MANNQSLVLDTTNHQNILCNVSKFVPPIILNHGDRAAHKYIEYFIGQIRNPNTRQAYGRSVVDFFFWCENTAHVERLEQIQYFHVATYVEGLDLSPASVSQKLAAIRQLFAWLVKEGVLSASPAANIKGPKIRIKVGKTPILNADEMRPLLDSIDRSTIIGLRDLALISVMTFTFARISAVVAMNYQDYFTQGARRWIRLHEKGGKYLEVPLHHTADMYLYSYVEALEKQYEGNIPKKSPLFRTQTGRRKTMSDNRLHRGNAYDMVKRRARKAGLSVNVCNHTFRGTGITNYLENGGTRDIAQELAGHEDVKTTALYDRRSNKISLNEIERMRF